MGAKRQNAFRDNADRIALRFDTPATLASIARDFGTSVGTIDR